MLMLKQVLPIKHREFYHFLLKEAKSTTDLFQRRLAASPTKRKLVFRQISATDHGKSMINSLDAIGFEFFFYS